MRTIIIATDITLTASEKVIRKYEKELDEIRWEKEAYRLLEEAYNNEDWDFYSDLYKDLYGVRPRW